MPKNKQGGKKFKKHVGEKDADRELVFAESDQTYGIVTKLLGNCRIDCDCSDNKKRQVHIRGKMRKKEWLNIGDVILMSIREFEDNKADSLMKYKPHEVKRLKQLGEIPDSFKQNETLVNENLDEDNLGFEFTNDNDIDDL